MRIGLIEFLLIDVYKRQLGVQRLQQLGGQQPEQPQQKQADEAQKDVYKRQPVDDLMKQFGMSEQDLDNMENRMESMMEELGDSNPLSMLMNMSGSGEDADAENMDEDLVPGSNATRCV